MSPTSSGSPASTDGACQFPDCQAKVDWKKWDKPPPGWAHVGFRRYGRKKDAYANIVLCPAHTMVFAAKHIELPGIEPKKRQRVFIEAPCTTDDPVETERNSAYLKAIITDSFARGEAPFTSAFYDDVFPAKKDTSRYQRLEAAHSWLSSADKVIVADEIGITPDMRIGINSAERLGKPIELRRIAWRKPR